MADDRGLLRTKQSSAHTRATVSNIATVLGTLAMVLRVYHAVLDSANAFLSIYLATTRSIYLHMGGTTMDLSGVFP